MNFDQIIKYIIWIAFFILVLGAMFAFLKKLGVI